VWDKKITKAKSSFEAYLKGKKKNLSENFENCETMYAKLCKPRKSYVCT